MTVPTPFLLAEPYRALLLLHFMKGLSIISSWNIDLYPSKSVTWLPSSTLATRS